MPEETYDTGGFLIVNRNEAEISSLPQIVQERISEIKEKAWS